MLLRGRAPSDHYSNNCDFTVRGASFSVRSQTGQTNREPAARQRSDAGRHLTAGCSGERSVSGTRGRPRRSPEPRRRQARLRRRRRLSKAAVFRARGRGRMTGYATSTNARRITSERATRTGEHDEAQQPLGKGRRLTEPIRNRKVLSGREGERETDSLIREAGD